MSRKTAAAKQLLDCGRPQSRCAFDLGDRRGRSVSAVTLSFYKLCRTLSLGLSMHAALMARLSCGRY